MYAHPTEKSIALCLHREEQVRFVVGAIIIDPHSVKAGSLLIYALTFQALALIEDGKEYIKRTWAKT